MDATDSVRATTWAHTGSWTTMRLSLIIAVFSLIVGTVLAAMRVSPTPVLRAAGTAYVNIVRNTPLTLVLLFCCLGLSDTLGLSSPPRCR